MEKNALTINIPEVVTFFLFLNQVLVDNCGLLLIFHTLGFEDTVVFHPSKTINYI